MSNCPSKSEEEITRLAIQSLLEDARKFQSQRSIDQKATRMKPHLQMNKNFLKRLLQNHESSNERKMAQRDCSIRGPKLEENESKDVGAAKQAARQFEAQPAEMGDVPKGLAGNGGTVQEKGTKASRDEDNQTSVEDKDDILVSLEKAITGDGEEDDSDPDLDLSLRVEDDNDQEVDSNHGKPTAKDAIITTEDDTTQDITILVKKFHQGAGADTTNPPNEGDKAASSGDESALFDVPEANKEVEDTEAIQPSSIIIPELTQSTAYSVKDKTHIKRKIDEDDDYDDDDDDDDNLVIEISDSDSDSYNELDVKRARTSPSDN